MDMKGILLWGGFLVIMLIGFVVSRRMKKQIEEDGIETTGVISRVTDMGGTDSIDIYVYARYCNENGEEIEGVLSNAPTNLEEGQQVRLKYHPEHQMNARLISVIEK